VESYDIDNLLVPGENLVEVVAANEYADTDDGYPWTGTASNNPGGVIWEITIEYTDYVEIVSLTPDGIYNPVGTEHTVMATVDPDCDDITVHFDIVGPNSSESGTALTVDGVATFSYTGTHAGTDEITAWIDVDCSGDRDGGDLVSDTIEKYWLEPFVTGGGNLNRGTFGLGGNQNKAACTFGGNVGLFGDTTVEVHGQFQIVDHYNKESWHCHDDFTSLVFSGGLTDSPPAHWDIATFVGNFTSNKGHSVELEITILDEDEPGKGNDTIQVQYLSGYPVTSFGPYDLDGGNFQVHDFDD
jgi:hypothetical protein